MKKLKVARGRVVITPPTGTPIAGNVRLDNKSRGVHDDLYCNILILNDNSTKVCLLGFDLIFLEYSKAFSQGGYEVRTAWTSQLVHNAGDILVNLVKNKILDNLSAQSVKVMERKASDNKYLHKDFHIALNRLMTYLYDHFGKDALVDYLRQYSQAYYKPLNQKLKSGDQVALVNYFKDIYEKEGWPVNITSLENSIEITQDACPAISHIMQKGWKPCPFYRETYNTVYKTLCENTQFDYFLEYFNDETGACKQLFNRKEAKL